MVVGRGWDVRGLGKRELMSFQSESSIPGTPVSHGRRRWMFQHKRDFALFLLLYSICTLKGLKEVHPHWSRSPSLLRLLIQMLVSSRNTRSGGERSVLPATWASLSPVKLTKINHHKDHEQLLWGLNWLACAAFLSTMPLTVRAQQMLALEASSRLRTTGFNPFPS